MGDWGDEIRLCLNDRSQVGLQVSAELCRDLVQAADEGIAVAWGAALRWQWLEVLTLNVVVSEESIDRAGDTMLNLWILQCADCQVEKITSHSAFVRDWAKG